MTHYPDIEIGGDKIPEKTLATLKTIAFNMIGADHPLTPSPLKDPLEEFKIPAETEVTDTVQTIGDWRQQQKELADNTTKIKIIQ